MQRWAADDKELAATYPPLGGARDASGGVAAQEACARPRGKGWKTSGSLGPAVPAVPRRRPARPRQARALARAFIYRDMAPTPGRWEPAELGISSLLTCLAPPRGTVALHWRSALWYFFNDEGSLRSGSWRGMYHAPLFAASITAVAVRSSICAVALFNPFDSLSIICTPLLITRANKGVLKPVQTPSSMPRSSTPPIARAP